MLGDVSESGPSSGGCNSFVSQTVRSTYDQNVKFPSHASINVYTGFLLRKVSSASFGLFKDTVGEYGLHPMHFGMLTMIDAEGPISQQELSRRTGIDPSTMVARMDILVEHGLVERTRSTEDRRTYEICLTADGQRVLTELRAKGAEQGDLFFSPLTKAERAELHRLLEKLADSLD